MSSDKTIQQSNQVSNQPKKATPNSSTAPENVETTKARESSKTLSLIGFIFSLILFVPLTFIPGLILSIIGLIKSRQTGKINGLAIAGIIISSLRLLISMLLIWAIIFFGALASDYDSSDDWYKYNYNDSYDIDLPIREL